MFVCMCVFKVYVFFLCNLKSVLFKLNFPWNYFLDSKTGGTIHAEVIQNHPASNNHCYNSARFNFDIISC